MPSRRRILVSLALTMAFSLPAISVENVFAADKANQEKPFSLTILHSNDLHSHEDAFVEHGKSVGGLPRIAHLIKTAKKNNPRVLAVDAGDVFQGTAYFETYKGETDIECLNRAGYDIFTLGNHDFDEGAANLAKQLKNARFDVISCNLDCSAEPGLKDKVKPSVVKEIDGEKVAFIGVITPAIRELSPKLPPVQLLSPGERWMDPVKAEVERIKSQGINKIFLVSHSGVDMEKLLAAIPGVDVVIGGHSHTRLDQAIIIDQPDGAKAMVVQTGCYGRTLGRMDLVFDKNGSLVLPDSKYRLTDISERIFEDPELKNYVTEKAKPFEYLTKTILATAEANFDHRFKLYSTDSPIGDLICDAIFDKAAEHGATITLQNRGGIRGGLEQGQISLENLREILPFPNKLIVATVTGKTLMRAIEHSVESGGTGGPFFDQHGMKYAIDPGAEPGHKVVFAYAQNKEGVFEPVNPDELYRIGINDYSFNGGEGFDFKDAKDVLDTGLRLSTIAEEYLKKKKLVSPAVPSRIVRVKSALLKQDLADGSNTIVADSNLPSAEYFLVSGEDRGVSFLPKVGVVPLSAPKIIAGGKVDESGKIQFKIADLLAKSGAKKSGKNTKLWVALVLKSRDKAGATTRIVSAPLQIR